MRTPDFLNFLYELSQNNNRDWFEKNKKRYETVVKKPFEDLVGDIIREVQTFENEWNVLPKNCIFRLHRDTRFSKDKQPYKNHVSASFAHMARRSADQMGYPGYYLQVEAGSLMLGGGAYMPEKEPLQGIRTAIAQAPEAFRAVVDGAAFRAKFPDGLIGERNKILPPELKAAAAVEPQIFQKQFYFWAELDPEIVLRPDCAQVVGEYFRAAYEVNEFLRRAMGFTIR
jgi:uncharacterized protein (TIGR02453 family)